MNSDHSLEGRRSSNYEGKRIQIFQPVAEEFPHDNSNSLGVLLWTMLS